jgi:hypothetical protein
VLKENTCICIVSIIFHILYVNLQKGIQIFTPALLAFYEGFLSNVILALKSSLLLTMLGISQVPEYEMRHLKILHF